MRAYPSPPVERCALNLEIPWSSRIAREWDSYGGKKIPVSRLSGKIAKALLSHLFVTASLTGLGDWEKGKSSRTGRSVLGVFGVWFGFAWAVLWSLLDPVDV